MRTHTIQTGKAKGMHRIQRTTHRSREQGAPANAHPLAHTRSASAPLNPRQISDLFRRWPLIS
jgi:hypothetical protein